MFVVHVYMYVFFTSNRYSNKYVSWFCIILGWCIAFFWCGQLYIQGLSGQPLTGPDIGGFAGNATPRMFGRWMGIGSLFPFCRAHSEADTNDHEPWSFGEEVHFFSIIISSQQFCKFCLVKWLISNFGPTLQKCQRVPVGFCKNSVSFENMTWVRHGKWRVRAT